MRCTVDKASAFKIHSVCQKSFKNHSKMVKKSIKIHQKSIKNRSKIDKIGSWAPRGPKSPPRALQDRKGDQGDTKGTSSWGGVLGGFWGHVGPKSHQKAIQNAFKIFIVFDVHFSSIFHRFWTGFGRVLGAMLASKRH